MNRYEDRSASEETEDPRFSLIAMAHADTTIRYFVRPDGSCNHIVIFDPETIADRATFDSPLTPPAGIDRVLIGGKTVLLDGEILDRRAGRSVRR